MEPIVSNLGPIYWLYFASLILVGTFIVINLFISVIVRKSEEALPTGSARITNTFDAAGDYARDKRDPQNLRRA